MFRYYLKKLLLCPATPVAILILLLSMIFSVVPYPQAKPLYLLQYSVGPGITPMFIPVACALPVSYVRHALQTKGAWQYPLTHSSPRRYTIGGLLASCVTGAVIMLGAVLLFLVFCVTAIPGPIDFSSTMLSGVEPFYRGMSGVEVYLSECYVFAANGAMWAAVAYGVSAFTANQYICAAAPLILRTAVAIPTESLQLFYLDPSLVMLTGVPRLLPLGGLVYVAIYVSVVAVLCGILFHWRLKRRLFYG